MRRLVVSLVATALAACGPAGTAPESALRPNMVVVLVDDLRWDDIGIAGHPFVETPAIDRIGREGAYFLNAFATTPLCSPSRASFLTGLYAHANGITDNLARDEASHRLPTFPRALEAAGYETAFIGKWHMGNDDSPRPGFTRWVAMRGQGEAVDPLLNIDGTRTPTEGHVTDVLTDYVVDFIDRDRDGPFLAYLSHKALHPNIMQRDDGSSAALAGQPRGFVAAERHRGRYADAPVPRRPNASGSIAGKPALQREIDGLPPLEPGTTGTGDTTIRQRLEMLLGVDESLARIRETLERRGELDDTIIVVAGDHGYFYGEHGLGGERRLAYEETARIPLLVRYPAAVAAGTTPDQLVLSVDLASTLLELGGAEPARPLHGRSWLPLFGGEADDWRSSILIEYYSDTVFRRIVTMGYKAVRTDQHKYIEYLELDGMNELYDLAADPYETTNVIDDPGYAATLAALQAELARLLEETQ